MEGNDPQPAGSTGTPERPPRPRRGDELELRVDSLAQGGRGVARTETGFVLFVAGGLPGDRVRARVGKSKKAYAEATVVELLEPAPERIPDVCIHGEEPCPGSPWQGLPYELQLEHKAEQVREALERIGRFEGITIEPIVPAVAEWRYRNKAEYSFGADRDAEAGLALGFHQRGRWDRVVDVDDCKLASEANNEARNAVRAWAREHVIPAYDRGTGVGVRSRESRDEHCRARRGQGVCRVRGDAYLDRHAARDQSCPPGIAARGREPNSRGRCGRRHARRVPRR